MDVSKLHIRNIFLLEFNHGITWNENLLCNAYSDRFKIDILRMNWSNNLSKKLRNSYNAMKRLLREIDI
jgi:hypothetical protein